MYIKFIHIYIYMCIYILYILFIIIIAISILYILSYMVNFKQHKINSNHSFKIGF